MKELVGGIFFSNMMIDPALPSFISPNTIVSTSGFGKPIRIIWPILISRLSGAWADAFLKSDSTGKTKISIRMVADMCCSWFTLKIFMDPVQDLLHVLSDVGH